MEKLKKPTKIYIDFIGNLEVKQDGIKLANSSKNNSNFKYNLLNFKINKNKEIGMYVSMMGGLDATKPIRCLDKEKNWLEINPSDRKNENIINKILDFSLFEFYSGKKAELPIMANGEYVKDDLGNIKTRESYVPTKFISQYDFIEHICKFIKNDTYVRICGEMTFSEYNGKLQKKFKINKFYIIPEEDRVSLKPKLAYKQEILVTKNENPNGVVEIEKDEEKTTFEINTINFGIGERTEEDKLNNIFPDRRVLNKIVLKTSIANNKAQAYKTLLDNIYKIDDNDLVRKVIVQGEFKSGKVYEKTQEKTEEQLAFIELWGEEECEKTFNAHSIKYIDEIWFEKPSYTKEGRLEIDDTTYEKSDLINLVSSDGTKTKTTNEKSNKDELGNLFGDEEKTETDEWVDITIDDDDLPF